MKIKSEHKTLYDISEKTEETITISFDRAYLPIILGLLHNAENPKKWKTTFGNKLFIDAVCDIMSQYVV